MVHIFFHVDFGFDKSGEAIEKLRDLVYDFFWVNWDMEHDGVWEPWKITWVHTMGLTPRQVGLDFMLPLTQPPLMHQRIPYIEIREDRVMVRHLTDLKDDVLNDFISKTESWAKSYPTFVLRAPEPLQDAQSASAQE